MSVEDKYDIKDELGSGEFSTVYLAIEKETGEEFAIKAVDKNEMDTSRLQLEIDILKRVDHPNIIQLKEFFDSERKLYLVMELVTGGELFARIMDLGAYSESKASQCVKKILEAVKYLHDRNIVHRDLKPTNLLLKSEDNDVDVKIADFGLSKIFGENTMMQTACGTPIYVAPEVLSGEGYDQAVDLWSVGVIMYILLCGFPPFFDDGSNMGLLFEQIMSGDYEYPDEYWDVVSSEAKDLIDNLLVVEPEERFTAEQALNHPWVLNSQSDTPINNTSKLKDTLIKTKGIGSSKINLV